MYLNASAILLDGVEVPKDKFIVYVLIGHSNMGGSTAAYADEVTHPRAWNFRWFDENNWVLAKETGPGLSGGLSGRTNGGLGMWFLKMMVEEYPDYYFGVIVTASLSSTCKAVNTGNNTSQFTREENRWTRGTPLYEETITAVNRVKAEATFGGLMCMLGAVEGTRVPADEQQRFSDDIAEMVATMREDMGIEKLPFFMGQYEEDAYGSFSIELPGPKIVYDQSNLVPSKVENSVLVLSGGVEMLDDHHFRPSTDGYGEWARRALAHMKEQNWEPPQLQGYYDGTSTIQFGEQKPQNFQLNNTGNQKLYSISGQLKVSNTELGKNANLPTGIYVGSGKKDLQK